MTLPIIKYECTCDLPYFTNKQLPMYEQQCKNEWIMYDCEVSRCSCRFNMFLDKLSCAEDIDSYLV